MSIFEREYLKPQVKDTIKRAKRQTCMSIFEREYLKPQVKDTDFTLLLTTQIA